MIITEKEGRFVTGRVYPRIVLISAKVADDETTLTLSAPHIEDLTVNIPNEVDNKINTNVSTALVFLVFFFIWLENYSLPQNIIISSIFSSIHSTYQL